MTRDLRQTFGSLWRDLEAHLGAHLTRSTSVQSEDSTLARTSPPAGVSRTVGCRARTQHEAIFIAGGVALLAGASAAVASPLPGTPVASEVGQLSSPWLGAVTRFYESRGNAPIWFRSGPHSQAATRLAEILERAPVDGLANGPQLAREVVSAVQRAQSGRPGALLQAELTLSSAWVTYVLALRTQPSPVHHGDSQVNPRTGVATVLFDAVSASSLEEHLASTSDVNPIYSKLRNAAWHEYQSNGGEIDKRVLANLARTRTLRGTGRYVVVDLASAQLFMYEEGVVRDRMKVVVGDLDHRTPLIASLIHYTTLNPYWSPPEDLVRKKIAPAILQQGSSYLRDREYEVLAGWADDAPLVSPDEVDWAAVAADKVKVRLRRKPSPANPMGAIKIPFANKAQIYLHDTPARGFFDQDSRAVSNGCIRLENASRLARWLLGREPVAPSAAPERHLQLEEAVPIYLTYLTAHPTADGITFSKDVYGFDREWEHELASAGGSILQP